MVGRLLVGFVWLYLQFSVSWLVDFQWGSCGSIYRFLCHGWQTFSAVRVALSQFSVMVVRLLVGFVCLNLQFFVSWLVDFQCGSCGSIFSFLCHGWQTFSGVRVAQSLVFCVMVGRLLVGFVWLYLQFSPSWLVDFQCGSCGSIYRFLCHGWQTFSAVRVALSLVFCVMVGRLLVGFVWLNLQFSVSWLVDFKWGSCGSIFSFLCHGRQTFSGVRVALSLVFCVMVGRLLVGFVWLYLQFSVYGRQTFSGVCVAQSLVFCVMVGRLLVGFVWLNIQISVSWLVDFQCGSCGSIFSFLCHGWQTFSGVRVALSLVFCVMIGRLLVGFVWLYLQFSVSWQVDFQWGSCGSIFSFLCHGWQTFSGVRVALSLVFCVMVGRLLVGFVWLNLQFSVSWLVDFQWGSCGSIFSFLCHGWQTFSGVRVALSLVFCVMVGRLLVGFVWLYLQFSVSGRLLVGLVWLNLQFSVSWLVDFQWGSCGSIFSFLCHGWQTFSGVRVAQSLVFCVMVGRLLVGFVWLNLQFSVSWLVDFQSGQCGSIFTLLSHGLDFQWGSCGSIFSFLCHGWQTFSGVRVALSLVFCVMVGRLLVGFVWLNLQFSVSWLVDFQWGSCGSIFSFLCHGWQTFSGVRVALSLVFCVMVGRLLVGFVWLYLQFSVSWQVDFQWGSCGSIFSFLCHGRQTFSGVRVALSLVFCVMVGRLLVGFVWLNLQFSVSWLVDFQWGSCGSIFSFLCHGWQTFSGVRVALQTFSGVCVLFLQFSASWLVDFQWGSCGSIFSFLCHGWQTFSGVRVALSLVFCVMVGRLLVGFVWLYLQFSVSWLVDFQWGQCGSIFTLLSVSWLVDFQWGSCGSIFSFLSHGWQTFSGVRVAQSLVFCVMVGRLLVGFVWLNLYFTVSWLVDFQWGSCGSIFSFLCHGWQTFSGVRVALSLVFCVMVGRLLVGFVWLNLQFSVSWLVDFSGVSVAQSLVFCVMVGRLLAGLVWLYLQFSVSWQVDFQWGSCGSIFSFLCYGRQTFSGVRVALSLVFCVMVGRLLVGLVWLNLYFTVSWLVDFQWGSCGSIYRFLCHGWQTFSGVRVALSLVFCVMVGRLLVGFVWLNIQISVSWLVDFQCGSCGSVLVFCHGCQTFSGVRVSQSLVFVSWLVDFQCGSCGSIFSFLCHGWQTFSGVRVAQSLVFCVMVGRLLVGFVCSIFSFLCLSFSRVSVAQSFLSWLVDFQWGSCGSIYRFLCHGWQTFSGVRVALSLVFCVMVGRLLVGFVWLYLQFSVSWLVDFQWGSCGSIFSFLCYGRQTFSGVRVALSLVFCVMVGRLLVGFVWLYLQFSVSWQVDFQWGSCGSIFSFLCHGWQTFSGVRVAQSLVFCVMVGRLLVGFVWLYLQFSVSWLVDFQWGSCGSIFSFLCHGWQTFSGVRVAQSLVFCVMVGRLLVGFVWLYLQFSVSWLVDFQWGSCGSIFSFLCHGWQTFSGVRVALSLVFCVMVGRLLVGFVWLYLQFSVSWLVDFQWGSCGSIFSFLCHGWQTFSGVRVAQSLVFCVMVGRLLVGFVWLYLQFSVSWQVDFQWGSCGSIFSFLCHGWQTFSRVSVAQSLVFCVMVGRLLVGFVWLNIQISVSWLVDFQWGSCGSIFSFLCHGWQTFSGVRVAQSLVFCVMVGRLLVGFVWLYLQFSVSWLVDFQWGSCGSIFSFLCHGWQTFSRVSVAQSLLYCLMVGRLLVGFVWLNLQFSVSWLVDFQWGSCGSIFSFLCHGWQTFSGVRVAQSLVFCVMVGRLLVGFVWLYLQFSVSWLQTFSGVRVALSLVFCVMVGRLLVGFVWLNLQFSVSWLVDFQRGQCGSIFSFLCHGWQTFSGVRVALSLVFCVMVGRLLVGFVWLYLQFSVSWQVDFQWGSCGSIFSFLCHGRQTFSGVRVALSLVFCVMVDRLLVGLVWLNLYFTVSWLVDFQWGSCGSIYRFLCHGWQTFSAVRVALSLVFCVMVGRLLVGFVWLNIQISVSWLVDFQCGSCGSVLVFCHGCQTFSGVRVSQSLVFCVMVGRLLVRFVWLNLQFPVSWLVDFQWGSCGSIFSFLCHGWQTFSGVRVALSLVFSVMVGRLLVRFVWLNIQISVSWLVDFQCGSCGSIFSFLCHGWQTFSGVRVALSLVFCVMVGRLLSGVRVALSLVFCVMVGRLLVGFVWLYLQFSVVWQVDFQSGQCGSIFTLLSHGWQTFSGVRVAQYIDFCVMVGRLLVRFVWLYLQFSVSWLVDFQWGSCGSIFSFLCHDWQTFSGVRVALSLVFCVIRQTFSGVRVALSLVFCVMVGRLLVGFVWLYLQFSVSWLVDFQWGSCGSIFSFLCHGRQTFSGVRVALSLVFCVMVGRLLVGLVWLNLQFSVSWLVDFQWGSCGSIFSFLCHGWQTFSGVRVAQSLVFCVMVGRLLVGFVWLYLQFSVSWLVDFQRGQCGSIFSFLCHGWQTFSGVRVALSLVFCVMVGRLLVGFVWLYLQFSVSWQVDFQWGSCGSIFSFLCHGRQTFSGVRVALSLVFCVMVGRLLVGLVWLNLYFTVSWLVDFQWGSCGSIYRFLCHGWQTFSAVRVALSLVFCVMVGRLLVGFVWLNIQISVSWLVDFQCGSCGSVLVFCHGCQTFSGVRVSQSLVFCVMVGRLLVRFVWLNLQFPVSWLVDFQWGSCGSIFSFLCHGWQTFSGVRVALSLVFSVMVGRLLVRFVWLNIQISVSWLVDFQCGSCGSIFSFLCHGWQTFSGVRVALSLVFCVMVGRLLSGVRVALSLVFCVMVGRLLVGFVWLYLQFSVVWQVDFQSGQCGSIFTLLSHGWQTFSGVRVAQYIDFCVMVGRLLVRFVWLYLQFSVSWLVDFQWGSCGSIFSFLCHDWQTFSGVRVALSLVFCAMVGRLLVGFVWLYLQFSVSWLVDFQRGQCDSIFSFLCHGWQTFSGVRVALSLVFCVMVGRLLVGFVWLYLQFSVSWQVDFQWGSCGSIFSFLCYGRQTFSGVRVALSLVFCVMVGRLLVGFVWLYLQFSVSWLVDFQWGSCGSIFSFLCHGWQNFSGVRVALSFVFCVMVGRLLVGFVWLCYDRQTFSGVRVALSLVFSVWQVDFQWGSCGSIFSFLCYGRQTFSGVSVALSLVFCVMVDRLLVWLVWLNLYFTVSWLVDFQWGSCGSIYRFLCHGWQTFSAVRVALSLVFCVMVGRLLVGFVWLNIQISVSWLVDFQCGSCGSILIFCHGWQTFSGVRVTQSLVFCVMVGRLLVGFVWLNLQFPVSWLVDFQWGSCGSIFSFLCHGWQTFSGVRVALSLVFSVMVGRLLVRFVWLNIQISVSWLVDFQWGSCGSIFSFLCHGWQTFSGVRVALIFSFLCHGWQTFSGVRVALSLVFCVMVGRLLVGFVWLYLQFSVSWLVDFQWSSCGSIFSFLCMVGRLLVGFVWLNLQFSVSWLVDFQWGSCGSIFSFLCHGWQTFSGVRVALSLVFCVMVGRLLVGFVWLYLQFSVSWLVDFQWGSCGSIFSFLCYGWQTFSGVRVAQSLVFCVMVGRLLVGFVWLYLQFSVSWLVDFQWGSCGSIFTLLSHGRQTFSGFRVAQSLVFCVMVDRLLVGLVWLNLYFTVSWLVDFQWGSCGSIFSFLCHGRQTFSGVRVALSLVFCVMVGRLLAGLVWLNLQFSVSWQVDLQRGQCGSIFSFLCHGWQTFSGVSVALSLVFCVMVGRLLVGFVWLYLQFSVLWQVDFQWGSCGSIFSFCVMVGRLLVGFVWLYLQFSVSWLIDFQSGQCGSIFTLLSHGWQTFSGVRVAQYIDFCVMVGRLLVGFVWLYLQFSVSWLVDFQWGSCGSIYRFLCHGWQTFSAVRVALSQFSVMVVRLLVGFVCLNLQFFVSWLVDFQCGSCGSIFSFLCHGWQTFSGVRVAQSLVFCVMVGRLLVGFVWLYLQFSPSWLVDFQCGSCGSIYRFLCHGWQTFSAVRVALSLVFCVMVGRLLVGFVWLNLQFSVSWLVDFKWGSCGSIFSFLCHGRQTFSGVRVALSLVFCVMVGRLLVGFVWLYLTYMVGRPLVGFVWLYLQFSVSWLIDFQSGQCGSIFTLLSHGWQTFSGVRVAQYIDFCVMVGRLLVGFVWLYLQFSVSWLVDFQWGSCSIYRFLCHGWQTFSAVRVALSQCHGWQTFSGVRVAQSLVFCVMVGRLLVGFVWLNLQFSVMVGRLLVGSCGSIYSFLCHGWQTFSAVRVALSLVFCVMVGRLLVGFVWLNLQFSVSWLVDFQWGSCGSIFSFLCHGWQTFSGVRVALSLVFCVMVDRLLVGLVWLNLYFSVSWLVDFSGVRVALSLVFCVMVGRLLAGLVWLNLQFSVSWQVDFQWGSCGSIFSFLCHGWQTFSGVRVALSLVFCVMVGRLLVGFVWLYLQFSVVWQVDFQSGQCGSIFTLLSHGWQTFSGVRVAQYIDFCVMVGRLLVRFVWLYLQFSVSWLVDFQWGSCGSIFSFL